MKRREFITLRGGDAIHPAMHERTRVVIPSATHGFAIDPFEGDPNGPTAIALPRIARFLEGGL